METSDNTFSSWKVYNSSGTIPSSNSFITYTLFNGIITPNNWALAHSIHNHHYDLRSTIPS